MFDIHGRRDPDYWTPATDEENRNFQAAWYNRHQPKEELEVKKYSVAFAVWAFALLVWVLLTGITILAAQTQPNGGIGAALISVCLLLAISVIAYNVASDLLESMTTANERERNFDRGPN